MALNIAGNLIGNKGAIQICESIMENKYIRKLDLSNNGVNSEEACEKLYELLVEN